MVRKFPVAPLVFAGNEEELKEAGVATTTLSASVEGGVKPKARRKHRFHPGTVALRNIIKYQKTTGRLSARQTFKRSLVEIVRARNPSLRVSAQAIDILHELSENLLTGMARQANRIAVDNRRVTIMPRDMRFVIDTMFKFPSLEEQGAL